MRITIASGFFLPVPPRLGGAVEKLWFHLGRHFAGAGHTVTHLSRKFPDLPAREEIDGVAHIRVSGFDHHHLLAVNLARDFIWSRRLLAQIPPGDILVSNTVFLPTVLRGRKKTTGKLVANLNRMPKGQTRFYGAVDRIQAVSGAVMKKAIRDNPRLEDRCRLFPNAIDFRKLAASNRRTTPPAVGYIGRLHPEKGIELLIEAAGLLQRDPALPPFRLVLRGPWKVPEGGAGEAFRKDLERRIGALPFPERAELLPPEYDEDRLAQCFQALDIFCYPSLAERGEAAPVAPLEAMAAGAVPVVSALECFRDLVTDGQQGLTFQHRHGNPAGNLANALKRLLGADSTRTDMAVTAQRKAADFDYAAIAKRHLADFAALCRE